MSRFWLVPRTSDCLDSVGRQLPLSLGRKELARWWWTSCGCDGTRTRRPCSGCRTLGARVGLLSRRMMDLTDQGILTIHPENRKPHLVRVNGTTEVNKGSTLLLKPTDTITIGNDDTTSGPWMVFEVVENHRMVTPDEKESNNEQGNRSQEARRRLFGAKKSKRHDDDDNEEEEEEPCWLRTPYRKRRRNYKRRSRPWTIQTPPSPPTPPKQSSQQSSSSSSSSLANLSRNAPSVVHVPQGGESPKNSAGSGITCSFSPPADLPNEENPNVQDQREPPCLAPTSPSRRYVPRRLHKRFDEDSSLLSGSSHGKKSSLRKSCAVESTKPEDSKSTSSTTSPTSAEVKAFMRQQPQTQIPVPSPRMAVSSSLSHVSMPECPTWVDNGNDDDDDNNGIVDPPPGGWSPPEEEEFFCHQMTLDDWRRLERNGDSATGQALAGLVLAQRRHLQDPHWLPEIARESRVRVPS